MSTSNQEIKKKTNKIKIFQGQNKEVFVMVDADLLRDKELEVEFYDLQGRKFYKKQLVESISTIPMDVIGKKGFSIVAVKDLKSGTRMAVGKVILM